MGKEKNWAGGGECLGNTVLKVPQHHDCDCEIQSGDLHRFNFIRLVNKNPLLCSMVS
ncbi:hypothetical protein NC651_014381 [Populus alba x Populus x berolinensis]|nr:hypothetical protein NC651_014381 [Populus alba x Populus x berolinensis]